MSVVLRIGSFASTTTSVLQLETDFNYKIVIIKLHFTTIETTPWILLFPVDFSHCPSPYHQLLEESVVMSTFCVSYQLVELLRREEGMQSSNNNTISTHLSKNQFFYSSNDYFSPFNFHDSMLHL